MRTGPTWSKSNACVDVERLREDPEPQVPRRPLAQHVLAQLARRAGARGEGGRDGVELRRELGPVAPARLLQQRADGAVGLGLRLRVAALERADRRPHERLALLERGAGDAQHELGVGGRAVVVDAELLEAWAAPLQRDALGVPERGRGVDALGEQRLDGLEADRRRLHLVRVAAVVGDDRAQHRVVGRQPGDAGAAALEVARALDARLGDHGGERALDDRLHADEVAPRSRASPRSWMSRIAMSARPACSCLSASVDAPGAGPRACTPSASS